MAGYYDDQSLEMIRPRGLPPWRFPENLLKSASQLSPSKVDVIDIHCHILPKVDDGPKSWDTSLEMCRMAADDGIEHIVATPHANERFQYNRQHLASHLEYLRVSGGQDSAALTLGCDFHLSYDNLQEVLISPERYTIEDSHYLLVELSNYSIPAQINECFTRMADVGITPVDHTSRAQSHSAGGAAAGSAMGGSGLRRPGNRFCGDRQDGDTKCARRRVATRT